MPKLLIIGGSDAGISAALRARELTPDVKISMALSDAFPNFSICGIPFYLSGEVSDWRNLAHRSRDDIESQGIKLLLEHTAERFDAEKKTVAFASPTGNIEESYDKLVVGTGAVSVKPPIPGSELPGVFFLRTMGDTFKVSEFLNEREPKRAVIVGGGYIGLEMVDALVHRGMQVTVIEFMPTVLTTVDAELGRLVGAELVSRGVEVRTGTKVKEITTNNSGLSVHAEDASCETDLVLISVGAKPNVELATSSGIETGVKGAIRVNRRMETNVADVYAAGDCVETYHQMMAENTYLPLGTTAHKQGRIAGENAVGGSREFIGSLGTQVVKIFSQVVGRTGFNYDEAKRAGYSPVVVESKHWDHKVYYPSAKQMTIRVVGDEPTGKLLGAQIAGHYGTEVSKRIDIYATALRYGVLVEEMSDLDLSYTPPLSAPWDPTQVAAQLWCQTLRAKA